MGTSDEVCAVVFLSHEEAYALAELCKRISYAECRDNAVSDAEARAMIEATNKVRDALIREGVSVR